MSGKIEKNFAGYERYTDLEADLTKMSTIEFHLVPCVAVKTDPSELQSSCLLCSIAGLSKSIFITHQVLNSCSSLKHLIQCKR